MLEIIKRIAISAGYERQFLTENIPYNLYISNANDKTVNSGFLIEKVEIEKIEEVTTVFQQRVAASLQRIFGRYESLEKNTVLLIIVEHKFSEEKINRLISQIEEDQYFFKKQVISYTAAEITDLENFVGEEKIEEKLEAVLYDRNRFLNYSNSKPENLYPIVSRLFTKLPFLTVRQSKNTPPDLPKNIKKHLEREGVLNLRDMLLAANGNETAIEAWMEELERNDDV